MANTTPARLALLLTLLGGAGLPAAVSAAAIANGGFETGDFTGWSLDSDGFDFAYPSPSGDEDFQIVGVPGKHQARIEIGFNTDVGLFANTLYQALNLSAAPGMELVLSFEWAFAGVDDPDAPDERFAAGLSLSGGGYFGADGQPGTLLDALVYGDNGSFSAVLDQSFNNALGWVLEFQINTDGLNDFGSYVLIDNVTLTERPAAGVPAPAGLFLPGLLLVMRLARHARVRRRG